MSTPLLRLARLLFLGVALLGLAGCVGTPSDTSDVNGGAPLVKSSQNGLINVTVTLDAPKLARGENDFSIALSSTEDASAEAPVLVSAVATMPAHGHSVTADAIALDGSSIT